MTAQNGPLRSITNRAESSRPEFSMPDPSPAADLFRFTCSHCQKVLKANIHWAGKRGACPGCKQEITFPAYKPPNPQSRTARQLIALIGEEDNLTFDDNDA